MQRNEFSEKQHNKDEFYGLTVVNAHCNIGSEIFPDAGINCIFVGDKKSQEDAEILTFFRNVAEDILLQRHNAKKINF